MNVIPFPPAVFGPPAPEDSRIVAGSRTLAPYVVSALLSLGEPATLDEICQLLEQQEPALHGGPTEVLAVLTEHADPAVCDLFGMALFRPVRLGATSAWAFSRELRQALRMAGMTPALRARL